MYVSVSIKNNLRIFLTYKEFVFYKCFQQVVVLLILCNMCQSLSDKLHVHNKSKHVPVFAGQSTCIQQKETCDSLCRTNYMYTTKVNMCQSLPDKLHVHNKSKHVTVFAGQTTCTQQK